jgi:hypothetical protein
LTVPLLEQVKAQEREMLPFDEPRHEYGVQLDGRLRPEWERAWRANRSFYEFNGDRYATTFHGTPWVPQVCADFIVDTIDRTAGTWYRSSPRSRIAGRFDLRHDVVASGLDPRRVLDLVKYMHAHPDDFEFVFEGKGPVVGKTKELREWLLARRVAVGDIIIFQGKVPWDFGKEEHNHSMFVTGMTEKQLLVTGNPIYPVERSIRIEGARTPKRRVVYVIRLTDSFLRRITGT